MGSLWSESLEDTTKQYHDAIPISLSVKELSLELKQLSRTKLDHPTKQFYLLFYVTVLLFFDINDPRRALGLFIF